MAFTRSRAALGRSSPPHRAGDLDGDAMPTSAGGDPGLGPREHRGRRFGAPTTWRPEKYRVASPTSPGRAPGPGGTEGYRFPSPRLLPGSGPLAFGAAKTSTSCEPFSLQIGPRRRRRNDIAVGYNSTTPTGLYDQVSSSTIRRHFRHGGVPVGVQATPIPPSPPGHRPRWRPRLMG